MKIFKLVLLACLFPFFANAQTDVAGSWKIEWDDEGGTHHTLKLTLESDGTYAVDMEMDDKIDVKGKYEMADGKMTIWDVDGQFACPSEQKGVYEISMEGNAMTMKRVTDACKERGSSTGVMTFDRI